MPVEIDITELYDEAVEEIDIKIVPERWALCLIRYPDETMPDMDTLKSLLSPHGYLPTCAINCVTVWNDPKTDANGLESVLKHIRDGIPRIQIDFPKHRE